MHRVEPVAQQVDQHLLHPQRFGVDARPVITAPSCAAGQISIRAPSSRRRGSIDEAGHCRSPPRPTRAEILPKPFS